MVESLVIADGEDPMDPGLWQEFLQSFTALKDLHLVPEIGSRFAIILQELVGEGVIETFPVLQNIFLKGMQPLAYGHIPEGTEQFVSARQLVGHAISATPITRSLDAYERMHHLMFD